MKVKQLKHVSAPPYFIDIFEKIRDKRDKKTKSILINSEEALRHRFAEFENHFSAGTLQNIATSVFAPMAAELKSCYGRSEELRNLKRAIKEAQPKGRLQWCPYCGISTPSGHDHYLPMDLFPEFAVHALNLVPICTRCNSIKGSGWLSAGMREYLHCYLDHIPSIPFLSVEIISNPKIQAIGAVFKFQQVWMSDDHYDLLASHFRRLKLIEWYETNSNTIISTCLRSARSSAEIGGADVASFLAREAQQNAELYGEYGVRAVLLREMSRHPDVEKWIDWL